MKYTLAVAALLGFTQAIKDDTTAVWELRSVNDHRSDSGLQKDYGDHSTSQANGRPPYRSNVMTIAEALENIERKHMGTPADDAEEAAAKKKAHKKRGP